MGRPTTELTATRISRARRFFFFLPILLGVVALFFQPACFCTAFSTTLPTSTTTRNILKDRYRDNPAAIDDKASICARRGGRGRGVVTALRAEPRLDKGFNLLEIASGVVPQGKIVGTAKEGWKFVWKRMMAELAPQDKSGQYQRQKYTAGGTTSSTTRLAEEPGRYHLFVGNPCPWCHRCTLAVNLLGLSDQVGVTRLVDDPVKASRGGWVFDATTDNGKDPLFGCSDLRELYDRLQPGYKGRCTAPLLVDKKLKKIVSNESSDIVRMLNRCRFGRDKDNDDDRRLDLYPVELASQIDATNEWVYNQVNNGVYRCGFSTTQGAYDAASKDVRDGLSKCDDILSRSPFLCGSQFTEADLRLLPTALRFDGAYAPLFKAGGAHLRLRCDYPHVHGWMRRCWNDVPGVRDSIDVEDACSSYYRQLFPLNPGGIVPSPVSPRDLGLE